MKNVYFDNAATTKLHPKVFEKIAPFLKDNFGNPSSIHSYGRKVRVAIEDARETCAEFINADPSEIYFTSSGTEANNFAIFGIAKSNLEDCGKKTITTTTIEHHCIMDSSKELSKLDYNVIYLHANQNGTISNEDLGKSISDDNSLYSIIHYNNETGIGNNISEFSKLIKNSGAFFHTDAVQSFGKSKIDVNELCIDSLTASAHKINGPKGIGLLWAKNGTPLSPLIFGGAQERNRRAGTENVAGIIGFAEAIKIANKNMKINFDHVSSLKNHFQKEILLIDKNGIKINSGELNSPYILSITFDSNYYNNDAESMLMFLDINGIAASNGAACTSGTLKPSHVMIAMDKSKEDANGSIRFSFSYENTIEEVNYCCEVLQKLAKKIRK